MWLKGNKNNVKKKKIKRLPVTHTFDCYRAFLKLHKINAFNKFELIFVVKMHSESIIPQKNPPMLNIIGGLQNILNRSPIDVNGGFIFKWSDFDLDSLLQLLYERRKVRKGK